jgi:hypothetical protein
MFITLRKEISLQCRAFSKKVTDKIKPLPKPNTWQQPTGASLSQKKVNQRTTKLMK